MEAYLRGTGSYVPEETLDSVDLERRLGLEAGWIESKTGISRRHLAADGEAVSDLAAAAGRVALDDAGVAPADLDLIIVASSMPDMFFPSSACVTQRKLGAKCAAFDASNACAGFLYALSTASAFVRAGVYKNILVIAAETLSRMVDWTDYKTCVLFGDGAGACVVSDEGSHKLIDFQLGADGAGAEVLKLPGGGSRKPASRETLESGEHVIYMEGGKVFRFAKRIIAECVNKILEQNATSTDDVALIVPHQSNAAIIREAASALGVPLGKFHVNIGEVGNTGSASVPLALDDAARKGVLKPGDKVILVSYGAGLAWASVLLQW